MPKEGEDVHIEPGWQMVYNLAESPVYQLIRVNGKLTFEDTKDLHLKCKHLFIRAGQLHIGSKEAPFQNKATITLYGERDSEAIAYANAIEAGNKLIANVNVMRIYGKPRGWKMTRLLAEAKKGQTEFTVQGGLDIVKGDRVALLPTSYASYATDQATVESYDTASGKVTITAPLSYYHFGKAESTGALYEGGADLRGEVVLMSRNVVIRAEDIEDWGGQIVTSDAPDIDGEGNLVNRHGTTVLSNVEIFNCSQQGTSKAAVRIESASVLYSEITDSVLHNGLSWGLLVK